MEAVKRKRSENDVVNVLAKKAKDDGEEDANDAAAAASGPPSPPEEEVEEFFAILRRMRDAMGALAKSNGDAPRCPERWTMAIETEVVEAVTGVKEDKTGRKEELFDLNVAPEPETTSS
ncbi:hypothetical protein PVL29_022163 [Vitis rotundifolia]|uniref:Uncharacterized protein n=1 Tax=Vitis rotundifolia TaxID=103349 RepID=A0AA39DB67_VITRO|nr:hypothetical protein PVL29_022163 [Vitis rotundifolia]